MSSPALKNPSTETEVSRNLRQIERPSGVSSLHPVKIYLIHQEETYQSELVNFHHRGACLRFLTPVPFLKGTQVPTKTSLEIWIGKKCIKRNVEFRIAWESLQQDRLIGVQFITPVSDFVNRAERFESHGQFSPTITAPDPVDPHRSIFFKVTNLSENGMLLLSSLSNRHLLPGMQLNQGLISFPGQPLVPVQLTIENTRQAKEENMFEIGVSLGRDKIQYLEAMSQYLSVLSPVSMKEKRLQILAEHKMLAKKIRQGLTFRVVDSDAEYEKVLKLRFEGYKHHGKVRSGDTWQDQGEGREKEGTIVCGYLGGQLVCSIELRFAENRKLRVFGYAEDIEIPNYELGRIVEVNKLVVHPKAQGSDLVGGILQKVHAILVAKGGYDILITSTDKLLYLYRRAGFQETKVYVPHPVVPDLKLQIMMLSRDQYFNVRHINPYTWQVCYEENHRYFESIGMAQTVKLTWFQQAFAWLTKQIHRAILKRQGKSTASLNKPKAETNLIDARWTAQEITAPVIKPYLYVADKTIGADKVDSILQSIGVPRTYFEKEGNWLSVAFLDEFLDHYSKFGSIEQISRDSGRHSLDPNFVGLKYYVIKNLMTPSQLFAASERLLPRFNLTRTYRLYDRSANHVRLGIGVVSRKLLPKHRESCLNWEWNAHAFILATTGQLGEVKKTACCYEGDEACIYDIHWVNKKNFFFPIALILGVTLPLFSLGILYFEKIPHLAEIGSVVVAALITGLVWSMREMVTGRRNKDTLNREFDKFHQDSEERYSELQAAKTKLDSRYREASFLEQTAKAIQEGSDLNAILQTALQAICRSFEFDRAFVMLADENKEKLSTAAVESVGKVLKEIWGFSVDISKARENPLVLSSVYHSGNPLMINDVATHLFQLNEASQSLIKKLGTKGFIMVPIPSKEGNWGVLIADKTTHDRALTRNDLVLLQRVAQHLGIALDKQSDLERETSLRKLFQKYVPAEIVNNIDQGKRGLGGQMRNIVCMFFDIRGFTGYTNHLAPQKTLDLLNRVFSLVHEVTTETQGWIDKFLGDGALVIWGAVGNDANTAELAVTAAFTILNRLVFLNEELIKEGMPPIAVGMGINKGPAVVGNVGSLDRMEFTSIGAPLNVASRLQDLCKEFQANLVISETVLEGLSETNRKQFELKSQVPIRGLNVPINIAYFSTKKQDPQ